jgi:hypothetical protein
MPLYRVEWVEKLRVMAIVNAKDSDEALEKAKRREVIEGSQDTEPGPVDRRTFKVLWTERESEQCE